MRKSILIPTDFEVESLNTLKLALERNPNDEITVVLMYAEFLTHAITDLIFYTADKSIDALAPPEFEEALAILKNRFPKTMVRIELELFHGHNNSSFQNFLKGNKIDEIYTPKSYSLKTRKNSFNPIPFIKKSDLPIYEIDWQHSKIKHQKGQLSAIFNN